MEKILKHKILNKKAKIGVIGLGYVGLPLAVEFAKKGNEVFGIDVDKGRVDSINKKRSYILDVTNEDIKAVVDAELFCAGCDYRIINKLDVIVICVPTPLRKTREPDISYIVDAVEEIAKYKRKGQLIILESTTYPGTTDEVVLPILERNSLKLDKDFFLAFSPERVDPGNIKFKTRDIPKVVGGVTEKSAELTKVFYSQIIKNVMIVSSSKAAEMVKLLENTFRSVNIGLVNEIALMCHKLGIDVWEIIDAAKTKPFGFMPFYPGPGLGGHCLGQDEFIFVRVNGKLEVLRVKDFENRILVQNLGEVLKTDGITLINPIGIDILSFDIKTRKPCYQPIRHFFIRKYNGPIVRIKTEDNRVINLTDKHPHLIYNGSLDIKFAKDIKRGERLLVLAKDDRPLTNFAPKIDLIEYLKYDFGTKIRVKLIDFKWVEYKEILIPYLRKVAKDYNYNDFFKDNFIPLRVFLEAEKNLPVKREKLLLTTGRGNSYQEIKAVIIADHDFCRLIGYYLSEGCLTKDKKSIRVRFSFNRNEIEFINDVKRILGKLGLSYSVYQSKKWQTDCIKVSSVLFAYLIKDILECGVNSYTMKIPSMIFNLPSSFKEALLSGLLRGDGSVDVQSGRRRYRKNGRIYHHRFNAASVEYFTINPILFQQVVLLSQQLGLIPTIKVKDKHLRFFGYRNLSKILPLFIGAKREKLEKYFRQKQRKVKEKSYCLKKNFALVEVKDIEIQSSNSDVYSVEVEKTNTFVTSYGVITHNCIPIDPLYLSWKARLHGFEARFIELADMVNSYMPEYVVKRIAEILNKFRKPLLDSKILTIGVSYKRDVNDTRESPAIEIIRLLEKEGVNISYFDPYVPEIKIDEKLFKSATWDPKIFRDKDCVVIITNHSSIDYDEILKNSKMVFDTRNVYKNINAKNLVRL